MVSPCLASSHYPINNQSHKLLRPFFSNPSINDYDSNKSEAASNSKKQSAPLPFKHHITNQEVGSFVYRAIEEPKKFIQKTAATSILTGLDAIGLSAPIKVGIDFIKNKTNYNFGKCGTLKLINTIRAESCLSGSSSLELESNYKLNAITFNFKWSI